MNLARFIPVLIMGAALLLASCDDGTPDAGAEKNSGQKLPRNLAFTKLDGTPEKISRFKGKNIILNVWATWCGPCRVELPSLQRLSEKLGDENYVVAGVSVDGDADLVREFLSDNGIDFSKYIDIHQQITKGIFNVKVLPETIMINSDGYVTKRIAGAMEWDSDKALGLIRKSLFQSRFDNNQFAKKR